MQSNSSANRANIVKMVILIALGLVLAFFSWRAALGQFYLSVSPGSAPSFIASHNGAIAVKLTDAAVMAAQTAPSEEEDALGQGEQNSVFDADKARMIAIAALRDAPLNSAAVRLLGGLPVFGPDMDFDVPTLLASERVSRRDRLTELSLVVTTVQSEDANGAMLHMDRLLTVSPEIIPDILPQLLGFLRIDELRRLMITKQNRPWFISFINQAIGTDPQPQYVAQVVHAVNPKAYRTAQNSATEEAPTETINLERLAGQLALTGRYDEAIRIASKSGLEASSLSAFTPNEENTLPDLAPLTWRFANQAEGGANLAEDGWVDVDMNSGKQLAIMERVVKLSPGSHVLSTAFRDAGTIDGLWRWQMRCNSGGQWETRWQSNWIKFSAGNKDLSVNVPSGSCPQQELSLLATVDGQGSEIFSVKATMR